MEAILDAAEVLLERRVPASIAAVAAQAGVSRVTVYAHFPTREALLEAVVTRAVERAGAALDAAEPDHGPPAEALARVIGASWRELDRHAAIARASAEQLSPAAMKRAHEAGRRRVLELVKRGRADGSFRSDLPADWLVTAFFALMHACGDEVRARRMNPSQALDVLNGTIRDVFGGVTSPRDS